MLLKIRLFKKLLNTYKTRISLGSLFLVLASPVFLCSESISICGLNYERSNFSIINSNSIKLEQNGESKIIAYQEFELIALKELFKNPSSKTETEFMSCLLQVLKQQRLDLATAVSEEVIINQIFDQENLIKIFNEISDFDLYQELLTKLLLKSDSFAKSERLSAFLAQEKFFSEPAWLKKYTPRLFYKYNNNLSEILKTKLLNDLLTLDIKEIEKDFSFFSDYFGLSDNRDSDIFALHDKLYSLLLQEQNNRSFIFYYEYHRPLYEFLKNQPNPNAKIIESYVRQLHQLIKQEIKTKNYENAFSLLKLVDYEWRTPDTHNIVIELLNKAPESIIKITNDRELSRLFQALAKKDSSIQNKIQELVNQIFKILIENQKFEIIIQLIEFTEKIDPISSKLLFKQLGFAYVDQGEFVKATYYFKKSHNPDLSSSFTIIEKLKLLYKGYYIPRLLIFCIIILGIVLIFLKSKLFSEIYNSLNQLKRTVLSKLPKIKLTAYGKGLRQKLEIPEDHTIKTNKTFVTMHNEQKSLERLEYEQLLGLFGLTTTATEKDIKNAYRGIVKKVHPDLRKRQSMTHSADFVKLTRDYERVLKLKKELFS